MATKLKQQAISEYLLNNSLARQAIINGNFDVWQRGISVTNPAHSAFLADRWKIYSDGSGFPSNIIHSKQTVTPGDLYGSFNFYRIAPNGSGNIANMQLYRLSQRIENGVRYLCGANKKVTVSFWARSSIANKKIGIYLNQVYGTGGSPSERETINGINWTLTSAWQKYTHTFETNTLSGKTFGTNNDDTLDLFFGFVWNNDNKIRFNDSLTENFGGAGNIDIAQVQLCAGEVALPFMPKSFDEELRSCMRYYEKGRTRFYAPYTYIGGNTWFIVNKRVASYTATYSDAIGTANRVSTAGSGNNVSITGGAIFTVKSTYGFESDSVIGANAGNWAVFNWTADAEL